MRPGMRARPDVDSLWNNIYIKALLITLYLGLNISLNMLNKWTISMFGFRFPIVLSMTHMGFSFLSLLPIMMLKSYREQHVPTIQKQWMGIAGIGLFFAVNVGLNNASLMSISLSLNQVIRACIPVATAVGAILIEQKPPSRKEFVALLILVSGVGMAVYEGNSASTAMGIAMCVLGTFSNGLMMASTGRLISEKMDVPRITWYTSPVALMVLLPFYYHMEADRFAEYRATSQRGSVYIGVMLLGCLNALAYNMIHSLVIKLTSSVTTTVIGEMKIVAILIMSSVFLGESDIYSVKMLFGCTTAILGFAMYSHAKLETGMLTSWQPVIKGVPDLAPTLSESARIQLLSPKPSR